MRTVSLGRLKSLLRYESEEGAFYWLVQRGNIRVGDRAGSLNKVSGYWQITIDNEKYQAHQLAFFYMTGQWVDEVDHRDTNRPNLKWGNLREATRSQNRANSKTPATNTSGLKGVCWHKATGKWRAKVKIGGKDQWLGVFDCRAAAHFAYVVAADKKFGEFARAA